MHFEVKKTLGICFDLRNSLQVYPTFSKLHNYMYVGLISMKGQTIKVRRNPAAHILEVIESLASRLCKIIVIACVNNT